MEKIFGNGPHPPPPPLNRNWSRLRLSIRDQTRRCSVFNISRHSPKTRHEDKAPCPEGHSCKEPLNLLFLRHFFPSRMRTSIILRDEIITMQGQPMHCDRFTPWPSGLSDCATKIHTREHGGFETHSWLFW